MADTENKLTLALNIIRRYINGEAVSDDEVFYAFPGLKESEDERIRKDLIHDIESLPVQGVLTHRPTSVYIAYLERQKEQKPAEWSEEEEKILMALHHALNCADAQNAIIKSGVDVTDVSDFLNDLCPQPHWTPSDEQMKALNRTILLANFGAEKERWDAMSSLYNDLLKLK